MKRVEWLISVAVLLLVVVLFRAVLTQNPLKSRPAHHPSPRIIATVPMTYNFTVPVLMYHHIDGHFSPGAHGPVLRDLTVSPKNFKQQMDYLISRGYTLISLREIEDAVRARKPLPVKAAAVTLDDGYQDSYDFALPILRRHRIPATVFIITATVGTRGHLTWKQIAEMRRSGIEFGSHTIHHYDLRQLGSTQLKSELLGSRIRIESRLSVPVTSFAYPAGEYNRQVIEQISAAGYLAGWRKDGGAVRPDDDPRLLPRVRVHGADTLLDFAREIAAAVTSGRVKPQRLSSHHMMHNR